MSFSRRTRTPETETTYLIQKYGIQNVQSLIEYLQSQLTSSNQKLTLIKSQKLRDQIKYLKNEKYRHFNIQKNVIIEHIMQCLQQQKLNILQQFQQNTENDYHQFIQQVSKIQEILDKQQQKQMQQLQLQIDGQLQHYINKQSHNIIQLTYQIQQLCSAELYKQAQQTKLQLQKQIHKNNIKNINNWKLHKQNKIKTLQQKHNKEKNSLILRLKLLAQQQKNNRNQQFQKLNKKIEIQKNKIHSNLLKQKNKYRNQINGLVGSRCVLRKSRNSAISQFNITRQLEKLQAEAETGPSTQVQTGRWNDSQYEK